MAICPQCNGDRTVIVAVTAHEEGKRQKCLACGGTGTVSEVKALEILTRRLDKLQKTVDDLADRVTGLERSQGMLP